MKFVLEEHHDRWIITDADTDNGDEVCEVHKCGDTDYDQSVIKGYAKLLHAAPDLIKTIKELLGTFSPNLDDIEDATRTFIDNAIALVAQLTDPDDADYEEEERHQGVECVHCGEVIELESDGASSPHGSMHKDCAAQHEAEHPDEW